MQGAFQRFRVSRPPPRKGRKPSLSKVAEEEILSAAKPNEGGERPEASARPSTQSACQRCRRLKKKCTRTRQGACSLCVAAWLPCSFPKPVDDSHEREKALQERISWLSEYVNRARSPNAVPVELVETGQDLASPQASEPLATHRESAVSQDSWYEERWRVNGASSTAEHAALQPTTTPSCLLDKATGCRFVNAYFRHVHRAYPFLDRNQVLRDVDAVFERRDDVPVLLEVPRIPTRLAVIMAIGRTTLQRANELDDTQSTPFDIPEKEIVHECLCKSDLASVEILTLLALYSLFEANSIPPWAITGILARKVVSMGLTRDAGSTEDISQIERERRRRLFWSVYVLDRMISVSYGLAPSIKEEEIHVSLPSITVQEYASADRHYYAMTLQVNRHVVSLRRLEGKILQTIHLASPQQPTLFNQGMMMASHIDDIRRQIDDWYTQGCLLSSSASNDNDHIPFHNTITWHNARYQNLIILLYSPSKFNFQHSVERLSELQEAAQKYLQSSLVLRQQKHLPLNWITLCRFLTMGAIFFHCYMWRLNRIKPTGGVHVPERIESQESMLPSSSSSSASPESSFNGEIPLGEIATNVILCAKILDLFPKSWQVARRAAVVFRQLAEYISAQQSARYIPHAGFESPTMGGSSTALNNMTRHFDPVLDAIDVYNDLQRPIANPAVEIPRNKEQLMPLQMIRTEILELIKSGLGDTSVYAYAVGEDESTMGLMKATTESKLFPFNNCDFTSAIDDLFQESDISLHEPESGMNGLWLDVMDGLGLGVL